MPGCGQRDANGRHNQDGKHADRGGAPLRQSVSFESEAWTSFYMAGETIRQLRRGSKDGASAEAEAAERPEDHRLDGLRRGKTPGTPTKLVGGVAVIKGGAATETELKEKKARVEDAMHATRAAVEEGIVSGCGTALLRCLPALEKLKLHDEEAIGVNIVKRALEEPLRQIAENAGHEGALVVGRVRESKDENFGFNAETGEFGDMVKAGVIDPAKVTRLALQNAASIVSLMLTTEVLIADLKGEEKLAAAGAGGGIGGTY